MARVALQQTIGLPEPQQSILEQISFYPLSQADFLFCIDEQSIRLHWLGQRMQPIQVNFQPLQPHQGGGGRRALLKACLAAQQPDLIDATAGLGRDAFVLASAGCQVRLIEKSPLLYLMLYDGLKRAEQQVALRPIVQRMQLIHADALAYLPENQADIIYLDPMYPPRIKSAQVKKNMQCLQALLGHQDEQALLQAAVRSARRRMVIKRPRWAEDRPSPDFSYDSKKTRYSVYLPHHSLCSNKS